MKLLSALLFFFSTAYAWAAIPPDTVQTQPRNPDSRKIRIAGINGIYKFSSRNEVIADAAIVNGRIEANLGRVSMDVYKGEPVALEFLDNGQILMTLRLPENEMGKIPAQYILSRLEFEALNFKWISTGTAQDLEQQYSGYLETQVASRGSNKAQSRKHRFRQESSERGMNIRGGGGNFGFSCTTVGGGGAIKLISIGGNGAFVVKGPLLIKAAIP